jgi:hypothetical protein
MLQSGVPRLKLDAKKRYRRVEKSGGKECTVPRDDRTCLVDLVPKSMHRVKYGRLLGSNHAQGLSQPKTVLNVDRKTVLRTAW